MNADFTDFQNYLPLILSENTDQKTSGIG